MTTEAKVEAVAWQLRVLHKPFLRADMRWSKWQACSEEEFDAVQRGDPYCEYETVESRALYPKSALDALRGEVRELTADRDSWREQAEDRLREWDKQRGEVERWKSLHDSASLSLEVQSGALSSALSRAIAAERRVAECETVLATILGGMLSGAVKCKPLMTKRDGDYVVGSLQELIEQTLTKESP